MQTVNILSARDRWKKPATELIDFRQSLHQCLNPWGDALFELCDAM